MFLNEQNIGTSFAEIQQPEIIASPNWMVTKNRLLDEFFLLESLLLKKDVLQTRGSSKQQMHKRKEQQSEMAYIAFGKL